MSNTIYIKKTQEKFDAIVVGSGVTGGWAAKELCEKGLKTLMVERGRPVEHRKDYVGEGVKPWEMPFRGKIERDIVDEQYYIQKQNYAFNDATKHFFANDRDHPYSTPQEKPFSWIRGNQLGGKSLLWHRQSYRWSDLDFTANAKDGHGVDWPIRYKDIESWYDYVEHHVGISGSVENIPVLPDSKFLPPFEFNAVEKDLKAKFEKKYSDRKLIMGRCAHLSKPAPHHIEQGRYQCMGRNECQKGCTFGAYFSTQSSTLPAALKTNNLSIATNSIVHSVIYDPKTNRATGVRVIDSETLETREYFAKVIFLCASTLGTTHVMLNSISEAFPTGIANSSGVLGHYLMDHLYGAGANGTVPGFEDEYYSGRRPTGVYIPRFRNVTKKMPTSCAVIPLPVAQRVNTGASLPTKTALAWILKMPSKVPVNGSSVCAAPVRCCRAMKIRCRCIPPRKISGVCRNYTLNAITPTMTSRCSTTSRTPPQKCWSQPVLRMCSAPLRSGHPACPSTRWVLQEWVKIPKLLS
jgi:choline dehydrogenase-like flavoprotein